MSAATNTDVNTLVEKFNGYGYGDFKKEVAEAIIAMLEPIQQRYKEIRQDEGYMKEVFLDGAKRAAERAQVTLEKVYNKIGFVRY